jgi:hypothetical protein
VAKRNGGDQGGLGGDESGLGGGGPQQHLGGPLQQISERLEGASNSWEKPSVKVDEAKETLQLSDVCRRWAVLDGGDMSGERGDTSLIHHMTLKLERRDRKHTLGWVDGQSVLLQDLKKLL